jgi:hypothetical protein
VHSREGGTRVRTPLWRGPFVVAVLAVGMTWTGCTDKGPGGAEEVSDDLSRSSSALTEAVTPGQAASPVYRAYRALLTQPHPLAAVNGQTDTLSEYAAKCDLATGIHVPSFNCDVGTEVPNQGTTPDNGTHSPTCDYPNVLNGACDPGSKFQVLVQTTDAAAVAHCRKNGIPIAGSIYNDIAVIQYNKKNGAVCFYQALSNLAGQNVVSPSAGPSVFPWLSPTSTEGIHCTGCHDNGGFIRSMYLAQLTTPPNVLPNTGAGFNNLNTPLAYVGLDFVTNRSWSIATNRAPGDTGPPCDSCHRLGVNNYRAFGIINGTAGHFANVATASTQVAKNPHSAASPIWMRLGQITYNAQAEASATLFQNCAVGFWAGQSDGFANGTATSGCTFAPLGTTWTGLSPAQAVAVLSEVVR